MARKRDDVAAKLAQLDCDPIAGMVRIAKQAESANQNALAGKMYSELAQYTAPKLKSMEISGNLEVTPAMELTVEQRRARIRQIAEQLGMRIQDPLAGGPIVLEHEPADA